MNASLRLGFVFALLSVAVGACRGSATTYALLKFEGSVPAGKAIRSIELQLHYAGRADSTTFEAPAGGAIALPTTAALEIRSGEGELSVLATALAEDRSLLASGSGNGRVAAGQTATITVQFVAALADAGVDSSTAQPEVGADLASDDGSVGQGGAGGTTISGSGGSSVGTGGTAGTTVIGNGGAAAGGSGGTAVLGSGGTIGGDAATTADAKPAFVLSLSAASIELGRTPVGGVSSPQILTVTNLGAAIGPPLAIFINDGHHFPLFQDLCSGATLAPGGSCTLMVTFNPDAPGLLATDGAVSGGLQKVRFLLSGTGVSPPPAIKLSPLSVDFQYVDIGVTPSMTFTVTNQAATDSSAIRISASPTASFQITNDQCAQTTLAQQGQCTFTLVFAPRSLGPVSGTILAESATTSATSTATGVGQDHVQLTFKFAGTGGGTVTGPNVNCRSIAVFCSLGITRTNPTAFPSITLSALPNALSLFVGWSGPCTGTDNCTVVMDASKTVTASFNTQ